MEKVRTCITGVKVNERTYRNVTFTPSLLNFFYGGNGAGKSTIAKVIKAKRGLTWDAPSSSGLRLMVFNEEYIKDNIVSYGNIPGVFSLTEEDADVRKKIDEQNKAKEETEAALKKEEGTASELVNQEISLEEKHAAIVWGKTEQWRKADFPDTQAGYTRDKKKFFLELYKRPRMQAERDALLSTYEAVFKTTPAQYKPYATIDWENALPATELLMKPIISRSDTEFAKFVRALGNLDWVRHGHDKYMGKADGRCPFCQGKMDIDEFERGLASCYDDQYKREIAALEKFVKDYKAALNQIYSILKSNQGNPYPASEDQQQAYQYEFDFFMEKARANVALLEQKLKEPSVELYEFEDLSPYLHKISDVISGVNGAIAEYMRLVNDPKKKDKASREIWSFMAYECRGLFEDYERDKERIQTAKKANGEAINGIKKKLAGINEEIDRLNTYTANTTEVMKQINSTLLGIGFQGFRLREKPGASYIYELIRECDGEENEQIAKDLSEGERNFIAFLYFYHTVMGSQNRDGRVEDKIVVIDDPVSSMDHQTLFYVSTLTRELIEVCYNNFGFEEEDKHIKQFFCLTHNPIFFREITYNQLSQYECATFFEITKDSENHSHVEERYEDKKEAGGGRLNKSPVRNYYDSLWHVLRTTESKEILMNTARQILDYHFLQNDGYKSTKFRDELFKGAKKDAFTKEDPLYYNIAVSMVALLSVGVTNFNDGLFFDTAPYTIPQMQKAFKTIFDVMGRTQHYNLMMGIEG